MRLSVLDVGSNTMHLLLLDVTPGSRPEPYASHKMPLQLVQHLTEDGDISEKGRDLLTSFVAEARDFAAAHDAEDLLAFATSAIREAGNGAQVLEHVQSRTGVTLTEISGDQESAITYFAVRRWQGWGAGTILDLDIGGGSFEMSIGQDALPDAAVSVPLGAGRLTRRFIEHDPAKPKEIKALRKHVRQTLKPAVEKIRAAGTPDMVVGTSKTFRSLSRICGAAPYSAGPYVKREFHLTDLRLWTRRMEAMTVAERRDLPGVSARRAAQILAGGIVAETALELYGVETMRSVPWALREGLILRRMERLNSAQGPTAMIDPKTLSDLA
ncbi:Ppx/GppA family phosphatase [Rothia kristinae]|uniref:Ppx/GppA family phosphatase n=1 Tax=Rothia kristinae TaxID=37923 RepID=A0A7T4MSY6_9MICC|nr:Ppx/GppA family phosphatase [Rothia kristinae]QQC59007.1 Ppx/GppA family phosphatase [Rothia kristinae]